MITTVLCFIASFYIVLHNVLCINRMNRVTSYGIWLYHALLSVGAFWMLMQIVEGHRPSIGATLVIFGVACKYLFERRKSVRLAQSHQ